MQAIILMTRVPYAGATKTRLMGKMSGSDCATLHKSFLLDYYSCLSKLEKRIDIYIAYAPENLNQNFLKAIPRNIEHYPQYGNGIGSRMYNAFEFLFKKGYSSILLVGADVPHIQPDMFREGFKLLLDSDIIISPTYDGGYCLIGLKKNYKELFINDMRWGSQSVVECTCNIANELGLTVELLEKYRDIDYPEDIVALYEWVRKEKSAEHLPHNTMNCLNRIFEKGEIEK